MTTPFDGKILVIGLGSVSRCVLPLLFEHLAVPVERYTVIDFDAPADSARWVQDQGATFEPAKVALDNYGDVLARYVRGGDVIIDLAWNIGTADILQWCYERDVRYVNASLEVWDPYAGFGAEHPTERTLYARQMELRRMFERWGGNHGPTAVLDHGANPGLVSHFVKQALVDLAGEIEGQSLIAGAELDTVRNARERNAWNELAHALDVKVIHISERDTQIASLPKRENEFVNTWSVEGFYEEGIAPAELGWGTHERTLPFGAFEHNVGPRNQICIAHPGFQTWVRSWVPCGDIVGMVIRHGEAFSISESLTVERNGTAVYRPTVHYAYCPADAAVASLHELHMRNYSLQPDHRILGNEIVEGRDELGCLLMGHRLNSWWIGSLLDIHEARTLVPDQNATTVQVAAGILGAVLWLLENPREGVCLPDDLPHDFVLRYAKPYLGPFVSEAVDWTPLKNRVDPFGDYGRPAPSADDVWQFDSFLVHGPS